MIKMKLHIILFISILFFASGCIVVPAPTNVKSGNAVLVSNVVEGLDANIIDKEVNFPKKGKACTSNFLYLVNTGDASIDSAKEDGHITEVYSIERTKNGLGLWFILPFIYSNVCTVVYGN